MLRDVEIVLGLDGSCSCEDLFVGRDSKRVIGRLSVGIGIYSVVGSVQNSKGLVSDFFETFP